MGAIVTDGGWGYGILLPIQMLSRRVGDPWEESATVDDLVTVAQRAEATGHTFVGVSDHVAIPDDGDAAGMSTTWYDTIATLGFLAAHTTTVRLVSTVYVPAYRHPLQVAKSFGTLDHLSNGRAILGVGAGHVAGEFAALGVPFAERGAILDETLEALSGVFARPYVSFHGDRYAYDAVGVGPRPPAGRLTVWIGGSGRAAWRRAGRFGDGYIPMGNPVAQYPEILDTIRTAADAAGRGDTPIDIGYHPAPAHLTGGPTDDLPPTVHFSPEALAEDLRRARAAGADVMHLKLRARSMAEYLDQLDAFADAVVPLVAEP
jgi:probable F420-dependent oxidoreductase